MQTRTFSSFVCGLVVLGSMTVACSSETPSEAGHNGDGAGGTMFTTGATSSGGSLASTGGMSGGLSGSGGSTAVVAAGATGGANAASGTGGSSASAGSGGSTGSGGAANVTDAGPGGAPGASADAGSDDVKTEGCGAVSWPTSKAGLTIDVAGTSRSYILRIPDDYDTNHPYRLIVAFHWLNGTAENVANGNSGATGKPFYGLWDLAAGSTVFVAPQGIDNAWRDSGHTNTAEGEDLAFTRALVTQLESQLCIDKTRVFAEGFSMGGSMSYAVACAMGSLVRAVAVHSGGPMSGCVQHDKPVAYFMTHGTQDSVCTYPKFGVPQLDDFAMVNGCMSQSLPTPSGQTPSCVDFAGCSQGHPTRACIFVGDHTPSPPSPSSTWVPRETWDFISQF
jgi:poly(3-hydroxybutyrate) depolymerase